jgi:protein TonB
MPVFAVSSPNMRTRLLALASRTVALFPVVALIATVGSTWPLPQSPQGSTADTTLYRVGGDVQAPRPISTPLPTAPERPSKQRNVVVSFVVTPDGGVRDIELLKHYNPDFDTAAVDAVAKWRFEPARKRGKPVAVRLETEIKFAPIPISKSP